MARDPALPAPHRHAGPRDAPLRGVGARGAGDRGGAAADPRGSPPVGPRHDRRAPGGTRRRRRKDRLLQERVLVKRTLGRSGIEVSALGMGTWAIGGTMDGKDGKSYGWGEVDDAESTRAIRRALDLGVTLFDTADAYGIGHAEEVLGQALAPVCGSVVVATKWGSRFEDGLLAGHDGSPGHVRPALTDSLRRLGTGYVDLYQLHINDLP